MAIFRSIIAASSLLFLALNVCGAIFEDQVGQFDWKRSFIGKVKHARFDNKLLIVTTHENVVAGLSLKTDQILWRQLMEDPQDHQPQYLHVSKEVVTISGTRSSFYVRGWDPLVGSLLWEWTIVTDGNVESFWMVKGEILVHIIPFSASHVEITQYNTKTGDVQQTRRIVGTWVGNSNTCATAYPYFACVSNGQVSWINVIGDSKSWSESVQELFPESLGGSLHLTDFKGFKPSVRLSNGNSVRILSLEDGIVNVLPHDLQLNSIYINNSICHLEANLNNPQKLIRVVSTSLLTGLVELSVDVDYPLGLGGPYIVEGQCKGTQCDLLLSSTDNALTLIRLPEGRIVWTREEALSNIVAVEFLELPVSELDASIKNEFATTNDFIGMFSHRLSTQTKQLYNLFLSGQLLGKSGLIRDDFGLHRIIVVATSAGKLFGIDTMTGSIVWSYRIPNVKPFSAMTMKLFVQRTARYFPLPAQCILLVEDANSGLGIVFSFDPITGISTGGVQKLGFRIKQAVLLPYEDDKHIKPALLVAADNSLHVYPENDVGLVEEHAEKIYLYMIEGARVGGFKLKPNMSIGQSWEINLSPAKLVGISTRPEAERVHSQGRVLPDRSVYYKYVNPNLVALASVSEDPVHKHVLSVHLVDGVTGLVLYSIHHKRAKGPVLLVHSENWLVYTFFNERYRRNEIVAAELYEGDTQSNSTAFSSFGVNQLPEVQSQSYILPATPVCMTITRTERGITNKFLLVGLNSGGVVEIPWMFLQPRFADIPCGPEESCIPYMPEIPVPPEATINYNLTLGRIKWIEVAPAKLESTSHVLVHGLDLFYTRVAPSKTFDLLKEGFDHRLIVLVLAGLVLASCVTKYLAAKKALRQAWK